MGLPSTDDHGRVASRWALRSTDGGAPNQSRLISQGHNKARPGIIRTRKPMFSSPWRKNQLLNAKNADQDRNHHARRDIGPQAIDDGTNKRQRTIQHLADQPSARTLVRLKRRHHRIAYWLLQHTTVTQSESLISQQAVERLHRQWQPRSDDAGVVCGRSTT